METKKEQIKNYTIHSIKIDNYKTSTISFRFRMPFNKDKIHKYVILCNLMSNSCLKYPSEKDFNIQLENLYNLKYYSNALIEGESILMSYNFTLISMEYINDNNYINNIIDFIKNIIYEPNFKNEKYFERIKEDQLYTLKYHKENPLFRIRRKSLSLLKDSINAIDPSGTKKLIEELSLKDMKKIYKDMMSNSNIDIFVYGNTDVNKITNIVKNNFDFDNKGIKTNLLYENKCVNKPILKEKQTKYKQSHLDIMFNTVKLTKLEREITFNIFSNILVSGGLSSKLYQDVREKNGLCYFIEGFYHMNKALYFIYSSLNKKNINKCIDIIKKDISEIQNGLLDDKDLENAILNYRNNLIIKKKDFYTPLNDYIAKNIYDSYTLEEKIELVNKITKEDIINVSNKLKIHSIVIFNEV